MCLPVLHCTTLDLFADFMWVVELFPFSTHNALCTYTCSKKKKKLRPLSAVPESLQFFSYRVGPCEAVASCTRPLSLSLLCTSKETWEHESVVLTTTHTLTQPVHTTHHHRKQVISGPFQSSKNIPSRTHDARGGEERGRRDEGEERGERSKEAKRKRELQQPGFPRGPPPQY